MAEYAEVATRTRHEGALDKAILMSEIADSMVTDREFSEFVMRKVAGAGNAADAQVMEWAKFVESLPYRRESGEVYRSWQSCVGYPNGQPAGGDCDDLTILLVAGCRSLGLQSMVEILKDSEGWGFHVRARVGLPPHRPTYWAIVDPVWRSEREWAMDGKPLEQSPLYQNSQMQPQVQGQSYFITPSSPFSKSNFLTHLLTLSAGVGIGMWLKRK